MSYRFCFGASGAGKSAAIHKEVIRRSREALDHFCFADSSAKERPDSFLVIVPEQATLLTQKALTAADPDGVIMNVDVLSFARLAHRVFEEISADERAVLGDTGKSLILQRLAAEMRDDLPFLGRSMHRQGMAGEVKSTISELMQYDIPPEKLAAIADSAGRMGHGALGARLKDIALLYDAFEQYKKDRFITAEDRMSLLAEAIPSSELIRHSVLYFDGFTGFTPLQKKVLEALMSSAKELVFSVLYAEDGGPHPAMPGPDPLRDQRLFLLSRQMCDDVRQIAAAAGAAHGEDILLDGDPPYRFSASPELAHMEKYLLRSGQHPFGSAPEGIRLTEAGTVAEEVEELCLDIRHAVIGQGFAYHDFGVITADPATYGGLLERYGMRYGIPFYQDRTMPMSRHPLTQTVLSALDVITDGYSHAAVFHYIRSGLSRIRPEDADRLENYVMQHGIAGKSKWAMPFDEACDASRQALLQELAPLAETGRSARERTEAVRSFLTGICAEETLAGMAQAFAEDDDHVNERIYSQVYDAFLDLLEQTGSILGDEKISADDFRDLLEAGFSEIKLGILPQNADSIVVGDLERSRLSEVKVLCLLGCNDGLIPSTGSVPGILSEHDREFLKGAGVELSPDPRSRIFQQKMYLYMNLTRPSRGLWVYCASTSADGRPLRPSFLAAHLMELFPGLKASGTSADTGYRITSKRDALYVYSEKVRELAEGITDIGSAPAGQLETLHALLSSDPEMRGNAMRITDAAFRHYTPEPLSGECTEELYGKELTGSVTRLEMMSECGLKYFLRYGLGLKEREVFQYENSDAGTVLHETMDRFDRALRERGIVWKDLLPDERQSLIREAFENTASAYRNLLLYGTARTSARTDRYLRVLDRTAETLQYQLQRGEFEPAGAELVFGEGTDAEDLTFPLPGGRKVRLTGRVDRFDLCRRDGKVYIKILDYKSGDRDLDTDLIRDGLSLQLMVYMMAVLQSRYGKLEKEAVPAALLYYRFQDPLTEENGKTIHRLLRPKGLVNEDRTVISLLDRELSDGSSDVIPAARKKDGEIDRRWSRTFDQEGFRSLMNDVRDCICDRAMAILSGEKAAVPVTYDARKTACTYCPYREACGFDRRLPGYAGRKAGSTVHSDDTVREPDKE